MTHINKALDAIAAWFRAAIAFLLGAMLLINAANIVSRSVFGHSVDWVFHYTILMFVWMVCLGFYAYTRDKRDVVVDVIARRLPRPMRRGLGILANAVGLAFVYMILSPAQQFLAMQTGNMESIALPIWVRSLPLFISAALLACHFLVELLNILLFGADAFEEQTRPETVIEKGASE